MSVFFCYIIFIKANMNIINIKNVSGIEVKRIDIFEASQRN